MLHGLFGVLMIAPPATYRSNFSRHERATWATYELVRCESAAYGVFAARSLAVSGARYARAGFERNSLSGHPSKTRPLHPGSTRHSSGAAPVAGGAIIKEPIVLSARPC